MFKVDEPSKYGVVLLEETTGKVEKFVEKPKIFVGNKINAGIYLLNPSVLDRIELQPTSIEKEVFPKIAAEQKLYAMVLPGFWMDIGQPKDYITGLRLYLDSLEKKSSPKLARGSHIVGNVLIDETAVIEDGCLIGPDVAIGPGCVIEAGVRLSRCTVMRGVRIKKHACISSSIIGWHSTVGRWARVENMTILGEDVHVGDEVYSNGGIVLPHKEIKSSILKPEIVMWELWWDMVQVSMCSVFWLDLKVLHFYLFIPYFLFFPSSVVSAKTNLLALIFCTDRISCVWVQYKYNGDAFMA